MRQRKDGTWEARLMVGYLPNGKADQRSVYGKTQQECRSKLTALRQKAEQGTINDRRTGQRTVATFLTSWLGSITPTVRASTALRYRQIVTLHLIPAIGSRKLSELRPVHIQACYGALLAKGQAPASVRKAHVVLHRAFRDAVRWGDLPRNLCDAVNPPALVHTEIRPPEPAEVYRLLETATAADDYLASFWALAAYTGAREGELLGLQWPDVDLERATLTIRRTLLGARAMQPQYGDPKTSKSRRTIRLGAESLRILKAHRQQQIELRLLLGPDYLDYGLVFATRLGAPLLRRNVIRAFKAALARAGLPDSVRVHDLRHFAATTMRRAGIDIKSVSERLGHSSIRITGDLYTHAAPEMDQDAADRLERAVNGGHSQLG